MAEALTALRVLIVDDEPAVRAVLSDIFSEEGFSVVGTACDGVEAISQAVVFRPDAVVLDVRMPRLGGLEAARQIRIELPDARIVMLSAYDDQSLIAEADAIGVAAFLVKGCPIREVIDAVAP